MSFVLIQIPFSDRNMKMKKSRLEGYYQGSSTFGKRCEYAIVFAIFMKIRNKYKQLVTSKY